MGLDWFIPETSDYKGPNYYRAKGLVWVLEDCGYTDSAEQCYGIPITENECPTLSEEQINNILKDSKKMLSDKKFSNAILDHIELDELEERLMEAIEMLTNVLEYKGLNNLQIYCDY